MLNEDVLKFVNLFTEIKRDGNICKYDDDMELTIMSEIPQEELEHWNRYLSKKYDEYDEKDDIDGYDEWYDNLEEVSEEDIKRYSLPETPIRIVVDNEKVFMHKLYELFKDGLAKVKPYCVNSNDFNACICFDNYTAEFSVWSKTVDAKSKNNPKDIKKALREIKRVSKDISDTMKQYVIDFNEAQGQDGVHLELNSNVSDAASDDDASYEKGGFILDSTFERVYSISRDSVNIFYANKSKVSNAYMDRLFSIIPAETTYANPSNK